MPPRSRLTKELIAETAYSILRSKGYERLNARYLASELGVSTMPLFHYYENMDEIKKAAVLKGVETYNRYMQKGMEDPLPFKGAGRAYIRFAKEEPELFKIFFMTADENIVGLPDKDSNTAIVGSVAAEIMNGSQDDGSRILKNMWLIAHGIATLEATGKMSFSEDELSEILSETFLGLKKQIMREDKYE